MRLIVVSNRLPVALERDDQRWQARPASGGLVTALGPILQQHGGLWIGWPGAAEEDAAAVESLLAEYVAQSGFELRPVWLTTAERDGFYHGFSNEIIWPLFHDLQSNCNFVPEYWTIYKAVNQKFADVITPHVQPGDFVWVQDYHLMGLAGRLRQGNLSNRVGFFLHIPFPPPDIFCKLPWRLDVLEGLLNYDVIGFQTPRDQENFADCVRQLLAGVRLRRGRGGYLVEYAHHTALVGVYPIGIDYAEFAEGAATPAVREQAKALRRDTPGKQIILGVDRLDYTKGIPYRLKAFHLALQRYPELHGQVTFLQVVVPSREAVPEYQDLKAAIERLVSQINGEFTQPGWVPIHHVFRSLERDDLLAYYRAADVALVTPLKDGMNLIAKEYCACQVEGNGVLILSEFAGAAVQLHPDAILVNPYDLDQVAEAIRHAVTMSPEERRPAMRRLRRNVQRQDVYWWAERFLKSCTPGASRAARLVTVVPGASGTPASTRGLAGAET